MAASVATQSSRSLPVKSTSDLSRLESRYSREKKEASYFKIFADYVQRGNGAFRFFQAIRNACKWPLFYAKELKLTPEVVSKVFKTNNFFRGACRGLILTKIPYTVVALNGSYQDYKNADDKNSARRRDRLAKKIVDIVADTSAFLQLGEMIGIYTLGAVIGPAATFTVSLFLLFQHMITFKIEREDCVSHNKMRKEVNGKKDNTRLITLFHEIKKMDLLKTIKSIASIVLYIFIVAEFVFSMSILPPVVLLFLSTATTVLAIWSHFYQESMSYPCKS